MLENNLYSYEDGKYCMQDVGNIYLGVKYQFGELLEDDNIPFKFRLVVQRYLLPEADLEDTLETHLYYLGNTGFLLKIYDQLHAKVKVNVLEERKKGNQIRREYVTKVLSVRQVADIPKVEKERIGMVVQELSISKLALLGF